MNIEPRMPVVLWMGCGPLVGGGWEAGSLLGRGD